MTVILYVKDQVFKEAIVATHDDDHVDDIDIMTALASVPPASADVRDRHITSALREYDIDASRRAPRVLSLAAAVLLVFGIGATSGWVVRNNNTPAEAQPEVRTTPSTSIPCYQLFPSINFIGMATPLNGETAVFLDTRSTPEALVLVSPTTCQVVMRYDLSPPVTSD